MGNTLKRLLPFLVNKKIRIENNELFNGKIPDKLLKSITDELEELDLNDCSSLTELPALPERLQKLNLSNCSKLTTLPELPQGLQKLNLSNCSKLTTLPALPEDLKELDLSCCSSLTTLPELPQGLQYLFLEGWKNLKTLPDLPQGLQYLFLENLKEFTTLPSLPEDLKVLELKDLKNLTTLPDLPSSLKKLDLKLFSNLTTLPALPEGLKVLNLSEFRKLKTLPELPEGLQVLNLSYCLNLTTLPDLPEGLQVLNLQDCSSLTTLPELPKGVRELNLSFSSDLTTLPDLPSSLQFLNLFGCKNLSIESIAKLEALEEANRNNPNFRLIWPNNLSQNSYAIDTLKEAYRKFYSSNPNLAQIEPDVNDQLNYPTLFLFQRFTSESMKTRGKRVIIAQAKLLAEEIKKNPQFLEILDQRSTDYLQACINQPVSGFAEIASLMAIVKEEDNSKKIEKAKILRAQQLIKNKIRSLINSSSQRVGEGFEVELGNAMLREVHKKLNKEKFIKEPWLGIPSNIDYEESIQSFLNPQNIQEIYDEVKEALSDTPKSQKDFIEFFCEVETNFWAKTILTKEEREQAQHKTPEEKARHEAHLKAQQDRIAILRNEIIDLDLNDEEQIFLKNQELQNIERDIENKHLKNLPRILEKKTRELLDQSQQYERSRSPSPIEIESSKASGLFRSPRSRT